MKAIIYAVIIFLTIVANSNVAFSGCDDVSDYAARKACQGDCSNIADYAIRKVCEGDPSNIADYSLRKAAEGDCSNIASYDRRKACESCSDKKWWVTMFMLHELFTCN